MDDFVYAVCFIDNDFDLSDEKIDLDNLIRIFTSLDKAKDSIWKYLADQQYNEEFQYLDSKDNIIDLVNKDGNPFISILKLELDKVI